MKKHLGPILIVFSVIAFGMGYLFLDEIIIAVSNPNKYHFGTESMIAEGGDHYRSLQAYVENTRCKVVTSFLFSLIFAMCGAWAFLKN